MTPTQYRAALDAIMTALILALTPAIRRLFSLGITEGRINRAVKVLTPVIRDAREQVAEVTERFLKAQAHSQVGIENPYIPPLAGYAEDAVREVLHAAAVQQESLGTRRSVLVEQVTADLIRHTEQAGRQMVEDAVEPQEPSVPDKTIEEQEREGGKEKETPPVPPKQPDVAHKDHARDRRRAVAWARGLTGPVNCAFCIMLASRGAVYKTKETATRSWEMKKYHRRCDCIAIPVYSSKDWPGKDQADLAYAHWLKVTRGYYQQDAINAFRRDLYARTKAGEKPYPGFVPVRAKK